MDLSNLTFDQLQQALQNSGYNGCDFDRHEFIRFSSDNDAVYIIAFIHEGAADLGYIYIKEVDGVLKGEF